MNHIYKAVLFMVFVSCKMMVNAQEYDGFKGRSAYQPYNKTYISPDLRGKHGASIGVGIASVSPLNTWNPEIAAHLGYNYLLIYKRKRLLGIKETYRDEVKLGFGLHFNYFFNQEWFLSANILRPFIKLRGKFFSLYLLSEYGFGIHHAPQKLEEPPKTKFNVSIEAFRLRFGKSPLNLCVKAHYDAGSALLSKNRMDLAFSATLSYYIYKRYKKK